MKISLNWLSDFLNIDLKTEETSSILTEIGLEVEGVENFELYKGGLKGLVVGKVMSCAKHPNADRLKLTKVDVGEKKLLQIVCGAPNVTINQTVVIAMIGSTLHTSNNEKILIKKSKIRGEISEGMICAEDEIGIGKSHEGIMILEDSHKAGDLVSKIFKNYKDIVFDIGLTPNRSDAMSHYGVARDLRAALLIRGQNTELISPPVSSFHVNSKNKRINIKINDSSLCPRFSGVCIENLEIRESPSWIKNRLLSIGLNPINNVVDITNFVLHELGQPLHAYDLDKFKSNSIEIKCLKGGTIFTTLDGVDRKLNKNDLMICDDDIPMCIAGVYGGTKYGVTENTKSIFLESAFFDPVSIRKTSKFHTIASDASFRFERGVDIEMVENALKRAAILICELCGGRVNSEIVDERKNNNLEKSILLNYEKTNNLIGQVISPEIIKSILTSLDFKINNITETGVGITVPSYRHDVNRECDVVEEVLRIYGFNEINLSNKMSISINSVQKNTHYQIEDTIANYLIPLGFKEIMNNSLTNNNINLFNRKSVEIINSISSDISELRTTLLESCLKTLRYNLNRKNKDVKFFEFGKIYEKVKDSNIEKRRLGILLSGDFFSESWKFNKTYNSDFFLLKNIITNIFTKFSLELKENIIELDGFKYSLGYFDKSKRVAVIGLVSDKILNDIDYKPVYYCSIDVDYLILQNYVAYKKYQPVSKFPVVKRDLSFIFDKKISFSDINKLIIESNIKNLVDLNVFDVYEGDKIPNGKKSYGINFALSNNTKTLDEKEINKIMSKICKLIENHFNAQLRDN